MLSAKNNFGPDYASVDDLTFVPKYRAACFCGKVQYEVSADPVDAKLCHCKTCQRLHGAPMQWAAIFHKYQVRFTAGVNLLRFYNNELDKNERILPCKVSCSLCGTPIADEGRRMWLAFPSLFDFEPGTQVPDSFKPTCHLFYGQRVIDISDNLPKWSGHKDLSDRL
ncbi:Uncharacterized conserved protein [Desulfuromusa kysingii]|uniref:Uncharacterized conserved protein n=1 Tax=Desulfuromusa kysingii TaxID=37625 RepID=A0A1H4DS52_9BACT|nr:GFA family protein [Desulfuromusa kysingii]SEA75603.1 Uncharacterized conserved protein [Desulfuromusa kysingii]